MGTKRYGPAPLDTLDATSRSSSTVVADAVGPLTYHSITPFRSVATPAFTPLQKLPSGFFDIWDIWSNVDSVPQIPSSIQAVTYNLTVTQTVGAAYLAIIPAGAAFTGISTINWTRSAVDLANNGTVGVGPDATGFPGCVAVVCGGVNSATHYLIDITGYYV